MSHSCSGVFLVLKFVLWSCTDTEIKKSIFWGEKAHFLPQFWCCRGIPEFPCLPRDLRSCLDVACSGTPTLDSLFYEMHKMSITTRSIPVSNRKHRQVKKVFFSMKSMICISRNSSAVKVLKSLFLINSQSSLHLHTGCLPSWLSYSLIASYWKWVMTLLSFTSLTFSHDLLTSN